MSKYYASFLKYSLKPRARGEENGGGKVKKRKEFLIIDKHHNGLHNQGEYLKENEGSIHP